MVIPPTHTIIIVHLTQQQQVQLLTSLAMTPLVPRIEPITSRRRIDALRVTPQSHSHRNFFTVISALLLDIKIILVFYFEPHNLIKPNGQNSQQYFYIRYNQLNANTVCLSDQYRMKYNIGKLYVYIINGTGIGKSNQLVLYMNRTETIG